MPQLTVVVTGYGIPSDLALERAGLAGAGAALVDARGVSEAELDARLPEADGVLTEIGTGSTESRAARSRNGSRRSGARSALQ